MKNQFKWYMPLALVLAIVFLSGTIKHTVDRAVKAKTEQVQESTAQVKLEVKESYKLDNAEYKTAVSSPTSFAPVSAGMFSFTDGLWSILTAIGLAALFFKSLNRKQIALTLVLGTAFVINYFVGASELSLAALPIVPFMRDKDGGEGNGNDIVKIIKEQIEEVSKKNGEAIAEAVKTQMGLMAKDMITAEGLGKELEKLGLKADAITNLHQVVVKHGQELNKIIKEERGGGKSIKTLDEILVEKHEALKDLSSGKEKSLKFRVNAEKATMSSTSVTGSSLSYREPSIGQLAAPNTVFDRVFRTVNLTEQELAASNGVITYLDVTAETNSAAETAETDDQTVGANNKPQSSMTWQEYSANLRVIADTIPVTRNAYRHLGFMASEIDRVLRKNQAQRKDLQIYKGDGIAPNIKGIYTYTTAVTLANMPRYQQIVNPNIADLCFDLSVYVSNKSDGTGAQSKYAPNVIFINPADALKFMVKGADGHYVLPPFLQQNGKVGNLTIVESPKVALNTLMVGDASYGTIYQAEDVVIEMGLVNDQFLKNQWTIRAEQELCFLQRNADLGAFTKVTDITAAITALEKP